MNFIGWIIGLDGECRFLEPFILRMTSPVQSFRAQIRALDEK